MVAIRHSADVDPAFVRIAMMALVLQPRSQPRLDLGSGQGPTGLRRPLYRLDDEPLSPAYNASCLPPTARSRPYGAVKVETTFEPTEELPVGVRDMLGFHNPKSRNVSRKTARWASLEFCRTIDQVAGPPLHGLPAAFEPHEQTEDQRCTKTATALAFTGR